MLSHGILLFRRIVNYVYKIEYCNHRQGNFCIVELPSTLVIFEWADALTLNSELIDFPEFSSLFSNFQVRFRRASSETGTVRWFIPFAGSPLQASVRETVTFTITVTNLGNAPAPNVVITDPIPAMFDVTAVSVSGAPFGTLVNVTPPIETGTVPYTVVVTLGGDLGVTDVVTIDIVTTVKSLGNPPINNTVSLTTSGTGDMTANNADSMIITLRSTSIRSNQSTFLPATGFAPNVETLLPPQPQSLAYATTDVVLEIPSLAVQIRIVGVLKKNGSWDVFWLGKQAGWLEGSAFPSWSGNSVLTSHVYMSNGLPGPFVNLGKLKFGDQIIVHTYGQKYIFEVQTNQVVNPNDTSAFKHEEKILADVDYLQGIR